MKRLGQQYLDVDSDRPVHPRRIDPAAFLADEIEHVESIALKFYKQMDWLDFDQLVKD